MATIDLNNIVRTKKIKNTSTEVKKRIYPNYKPTYVDLHLDLEQSKNIGDGLNAVYSGDIVVDTDINAIKNSLRNIFTTKKGQKILNPAFGTSLEQFLFTPISDTMAKRIGTQILTDVETFEPRIKISNITVKPSYNEHLYRISIYYTLVDLKKESTIDLIASIGGQISLDGVIITDGTSIQ